MIKNKENKKVEKSTTLKQDLYIAIKQFKNKRKVFVLAIVTIILIYINSRLINFNINLDDNSFIQKILPETLIIERIPIIGDFKVLYFTINVLSICTSIILLYIYFKFLKFMAKPFCTKKLNKICKHLGIYYGEKTEDNLPIPIVVTEDKENPKLTKIELYSNGTTQDDWEKDNRLKRFSDKFEHAVVGVQVPISQKEYDRMYLYYRKDFSDTILYWKDEYLVDDDCTLVLGENSIGEQEIIDLNDNPMWVIAGKSGSGKSVEMMSILMQNILKGNRVIIGEFVKGAVDYNKNWKNLKNCEIYTDISRFLSVFQEGELSHELDVRKKILKMYNCKNISEYNKKIENGEIKDEKLQRIIVALDEAGQIFIKSKDKKKEETLSKIRCYINEMFSTYRFCGVHAILRNSNSKFFNIYRGSPP